MDDLAVTPELTIAGPEITFRFSRSGGPGGQHVNTTETRVELLWDVAGSPSLNEDQRARLLEALAGRLDGAGLLRIVAGETRSQTENRARALRRLVLLVAAALQPRKTRRPTRPSAAAKSERLARKRQRAETKRRRRGGGDGEEG